MSKVSRGSLAYSLIPPMKMAWALFQGLLPGSSSIVAPHIRTFEWERLVSEALLEV